MFSAPPPSLFIFLVRLRLQVGSCNPPSLWRPHHPELQALASPPADA